MKILYTLIPHFLFAALLSAQPGIEWQKCYGGSKAENSLLISHAHDGGYIMGGITYSQDGDVTGLHGDRDIWITKVDDSGNLIWQRAYGGSKTEDINCIQKTADGGYIFIGSTWSNDGDVSGYHGVNYTDIWLVKIDAGGAIQWQKAYGGTESDAGVYVYQRSDGGYTFSGNTSSKNGDVSGNKGKSDIWIVQIDSVGDILSERTYGGTENDFGYVTPTTDGASIIVGTSSSNNGDVSGNHGGADVWLAKLEADGSIKWQKAYGGTSMDAGSNIIETSDGGYMLTALTQSNNMNVPGNHGYIDGWVIKLASTGLIQWSKTLGGSATDWVAQIYETSDHEYIMNGYTSSFDGDISTLYGYSDVWLVKLRQNGTLAWEQNYGGSNSENGSSFVMTDDGGLAIITGTLSNDIDVSGNHGEEDVWLIKLSAVTPTQEQADQVEALEVFPNPAQQFITVNIASEEAPFSIVITDLLGREVLPLQISHNGEKIPLTTLPAAWYFISATTADGKTFLQKFWKQG